MYNKKLKNLIKSDFETRSFVDDFRRKIEFSASP